MKIKLAVLTSGIERIKETEEIKTTLKIPTNKMNMTKL